MTRTVGERWGEYLRLGRRMSPHTISAYLADLRSLLDFLSLRQDATEEQLRDALTQRAIRSWLAQTLADGGARSTIARHTAAIRNFTAWALREGILPSDPAALLSSPRADQRLPSPLDESDARMLLNAARDEATAGGASQIRNWAILELTYACGLRVSEVCALDVSSLNREALTVRVVGKGNKERVVPYGPPAAAALDHWLVRGRPQLAGERSGQALFLGEGWTHRSAHCAFDGAQDGGTRRCARRCAPRAEALDGDAPAAGRCRPSRGARNAGAFVAVNYPALHPRGYRPAQRDLPAGTPARVSALIWRRWRCFR